MLEGAQQHWAELRQNKGFQSTEAQKLRVDQLIMRSKSVETFVQTMIIRDERQNVAVVELYDAYCTYCRDRKWPPISEQKFEQSSRRHILEHFDVRKSNDIRRVDPFSEKEKAVRGYHGIALVKQSAEHDDEPF